MITSHSISGAEKNTYKEFRKITISYDALSKLMNLPRSYTLVSAIDCGNSVEFKVLVHDMTDHVEGTELGELIPGDDWQLPTIR